MTPPSLKAPGVGVGPGKNTGIRKKTYAEKNLGKRLKALLATPDVRPYAIREVTEEYDDALDQEDDAPQDESWDEAPDGGEDEDLDYGQRETIGVLDRADEEQETFTGSYVATVTEACGGPALFLSHVPRFAAGNSRETELFKRRLELIRHMAQEILDRQPEYLLNGGEKPVPLEQKAIKDAMNTARLKVGKEHVSNLLSVLFFKDESGRLTQGRDLFVRRGTVLDIPMTEKLALAMEFLAQSRRGIKKIDRAKAFHKFYEQKTGTKVPLRGKNDDGKYKNWKNILARAEKGQS